MAATISCSVGPSMGPEKSTPVTSARNDGPAGLQLKGIDAPRRKACFASDQACSPVSGTVKNAADAKQAPAFIFASGWITVGGGGAAVIFQSVKESRPCV